ncbi:MAG: LptF/LptG family permease [Kiritimatiellaeota bacterium]|nr:LptF/LptG family permease [Kiritimatiellota bacterium]
MKILARYILLEFLRPLAYCLATFSSLFTLLQMFDVFGAILENKPPPGAVLFYFAATLAPFLEWIFSASLMLAALYTLWRFCRDSEVSAMRAGGVGLLAISAPILGVSLVFTALAFVNTEYVVPRWFERALRMNAIKGSGAFAAAGPVAGAAGGAGRASYFNAEGRRIWQIDRFDPDEPAVLGGVHIKFERPDRSTEMAVTAAAARHLDGVWWLENPVENHFNELSHPVPPPSPLANRLSWRAFPWLGESPEDFRDKSLRWENLSFQARRRYIKNHPNLDTLPSLKYDMLHRLAAPWACLVMTLFAIPAGIATGRQSVAKGVLMALLMFFGFYALTIMCKFLTHFASPWVTAWAPNVLFLGAGVYLFHRQR